MNVTRLNGAPKLSRICNGFQLLRRNQHNAAAASEYSDEPEYPPVLDLSREARKRRGKEEWHDKITQLPTVEQKMMELNMPKYYGYWSCHLTDTFPKINGLPFVKYATRTHMVNGLPDNYYHEVKEEAEKVAHEIQDQIGGLIDIHFNVPVHRKSGKKDSVTRGFLMGLHRILNGALSSSVDHLKTAVVDLEPRIEAFWFLGGLQPDIMLKKIRKNFIVTKDHENDPMDRPIQGYSTPILGLRVDDGLPEVVPQDHPLAASGSVPVENLDPRAYGFKFQHKHATTTTGFWPGKNKDHCHLWMHANGFLDFMCRKFGSEYYENFVHQKMILSSFIQAVAHATYLGFGPVTELTYPLVQQSVMSDGRKWHFGVYQLNTCALHSENAIENPQNNILWLNDEQTLFEAVDDTGVKGLNLDVLTTLVAMYLKKGIERENATPYLAPYKYLAYHPASEEYRDYFHLCFHQYLYSGRPRHDLKPEMYLWEKIYKVDFKTRPYEPPRRFFERHFAQKHPDTRRLDDYNPGYVPKALRKVKWVKHKPRLDTEKLFKYDKCW